MIFGRKTVVSNNELAVRFIKLQSNRFDGEAALIQTPGGKNVLIDSGGTDEWGQLHTYVKDHQVGKVDVLVASHAHADHIGNHARVLDQLPVVSVWDSGYPRITEDGKNKFYSSYLDAVCQHNIAFIALAKGNAFDLDSVKFQVFSPSEAGDVVDACNYVTDKDTPGKSIDNNSLVIKIVYGRHSFLFIGELLNSGGQVLMDAFGSQMESTVLKLAEHGGANDSNAQDFLDTVRPKYAVAMAGKPSRFHHPHTELLNRLSERNIELYWTGLHGNVVMRSNGANLTIEPELQGPTDPDKVKTIRR